MVVVFEIHATDVDFANRIIGSENFIKISQETAARNLRVTELELDSSRQHPGPHYGSYDRQLVAFRVDFQQENRLVESQKVGAGVFN